MIYFIIPLLAVLVLYFTLFRKKKTGPALDRFEWHEPLWQQVAFYKGLNTADQQVFRKRMGLFLQETYVEAVGFELAELDKILVAASAVIPVFQFKEWYYDNLTGVIIYPDNFNENLGYDQEHPDRMIGGLVGNGRFEKQMILSRTSLYHGFQNDTDKHNTGIHEFMHLIDKTDGKINGIPDALLERSYVIPWMNLMHQKMESIRKNESDIRSYGGTNQAEFFAVAGEYFFSRPKLMRRKHPDLYKMLELCFNPSQKPV